MKKNIRIFLAFAIVFLISILINSRNQNELREFGFSNKEMNKALRIYAPPELNSFDSGSLVLLFAVNTSDEPVVFQKDYETKVFRKIGKSWELIQNKMGYPEGDVTALPKDQQFAGGIFIGVVPFVREDEFADLRIFLTGTKIGSDVQEEEVSANIEITLHPAP